MLRCFDMSKIQIEFDDEKYYGHESARSKETTVSCECGESRMDVNFIPAPFCGCFLKVTCSGCGDSRVLFDDF